MAKDHIGGTNHKPDGDGGTFGEEKQAKAPHVKRINQTEEQRAQIRALQAQTQSNFNYRVDDSMYRGNIEFELSKEAIYGAQAVLREFPEIRNTYTSGSLGVRAGGNELAKSYNELGEVSLNSKWYSNPDLFKAGMEYSQQTGFHTANAGTQSVVQHELGHQLTRAVADAYTARTGRPMTIGQVEARIYNNVSAKPAVQRAMQSTGKTTINQMVSGYATRSTQELIAESTADYMTNRSSAGIVSRYVIRELKNIARGID